MKAKAKHLLNKTKTYILAHKVVSVIILIVVLFIGHLIYTKITNTAGDTRYTFTTVEKGTLITSVTGTGQVSASNQIDLKAKASGDVLYIAAVNGQNVGAGALIAAIDSSDAQKSVRDAQASLDAAQIAFEKLKLADSDENLNADLSKAYDDGFNNVSNAFLDLPTVMTGLDSEFYKSSGNSGQPYLEWYKDQTGSTDKDRAEIYKDSFDTSYKIALAAYTKNSTDYKETSRTANPETIAHLILETYETTKLISDAIKNGSNYLDFVKNSIQNNNFQVPAIIITNQANLSNFTSQANGHLINLLAVKTAIKNSQDSSANANLDIQSQQLGITQKQNALQDAKDKLPDYSVYAPFAGTVATINIKKYDSVGSGTAVASFITKQKIAEISLNEVDVAKIKVAEKTTLTFDAIPDLSIAGAVAEIDSIGTVSQGVVTYNVKISFDTQDERVKPGMSVSAAVITDIKQDVLNVPNSAVKSKNGTSYVEVFATPLPEPTDGLQGSISKIPPTEVDVEIGLVNDSRTEIVSGLKEGDEIVARTIAPGSAKAATPAAPSLFGSSGGGGATRTGGGLGGGRN